MVAEWQCALAGHPDREFALYILRGIREGFRIGADARARHLCKPTESNMPMQKPEMVSEYLQWEVVLGRMIAADSTQLVQVSPTGLIPKKGKLNKWRLIVDLSSPRRTSVNDGTKACHTTVDHLVALVLERGRGTLLVKADMKEAYRMVPVMYMYIHVYPCMYMDSGT